MDYFDAGAVKDEAAAALGISGALLQADGWALEQVQALMGHASEAMKRALAAAQTVHGNVMAAIRAGIITPSTKAELVKAETDVTRARAALASAQNSQPARILPRAREVWKRLVSELAEHARDKPAARLALQTLIGERIPVHANENGDPVAEIAASSVQISVVAGAGSVPYLTGPVRIPLAPGRAS